MKDWWLNADRWEPKENKQHLGVNLELIMQFIVQVTNSKINGGLLGHFESTRRPLKVHDRK